MKHLIACSLLAAAVVDLGGMVTGARGCRAAEAAAGRGCDADLERYALSRFAVVGPDRKGGGVPEAGSLGPGTVHRTIVVACFPAEWLLSADVLGPTERNNWIPPGVAGFDVLGTAGGTASVLVQYARRQLPQAVAAVRSLKVAELVPPVALFPTPKDPRCGRQVWARVVREDQSETTATIFLRRQVRERGTDVAGTLHVVQSLRLVRAERGAAFAWRTEATEVEFVPDP